MRASSGRSAGLGAGSDSVPEHEVAERSSRLRRPSHERRPTCRIDALTRTQVAIIDLIADGRTDKEIAYGVGMSYRTVRTHLERLYELNNVHCRAALIALVYQWRQLAEQHDERSDVKRHTRRGSA